MIKFSFSNYDVIQGRRMDSITCHSDDILIFDSKRYMRNMLSHIKGQHITEHIERARARFYKIYGHFVTVKQAVTDTKLYEKAAQYLSPVSVLKSSNINVGDRVFFLDFPESIWTIKKIKSDDLILIEKKEGNIVTLVFSSPDNKLYLALPPSDELNAST